MSALMRQAQCHHFWSLYCQIFDLLLAADADLDLPRLSDRKTFQPLLQTILQTASTP